MLTKKQQRLRRSRQTRLRIAQSGTARLTVFRSNLHIFANVISDDGEKVLASASTVEKEVREQIGVAGKGGNAAAATVVGKRIAETDFVINRAFESLTIFCLEGIGAALLQHRFGDIRAGIIPAFVVIKQIDGAFTGDHLRQNVISGLKNIGTGERNRHRNLRIRIENV